MTSLYRLPSHLRLTFLILLGLLSAIAFAQDTLVPRWALTAWPFASNKPQWSNAGDKVLFWEGGTYYSDGLIRVYSATNRSILTQINVTSSSTVGHLTGACLSADGGKVYYATDGGRVFSYDIASRAPSQPLTLEKVGSPITNLVTSNGGAYLAYVAIDPNSSNDYITVLNLADKTKKQFDYKNPNYAYAHTANLAFADSDTKVITSGPSIYDLSGNLIKQDIHDSDAFVVSPDGKTVFSHASGNNSASIYAYHVADLAPQWNKPMPSGTYYVDGISADGNAVLCSGLPNSSNWSVVGLNASTGALLPNATIASRSTAGTFVIPSPKSNTLLTFCTTTTGSFGNTSGPSLSELWSFSSTTGAGTFSSNLFDGLSHDSPATFYGTQIGNVVAIATDETNDSQGTAVTTRTAFDSRTGVGLESFPSGTFPSPDGKYYALVSGGSGFGQSTAVNVYRISASGDTIVDSLDLGRPVGNVIWGGTTRLVLTGGYVLNFDGTKLTKNSTTFSISSFGATSGVCVSSDGAKLGVWNGRFGLTVTDLTTGTTVTIANDTNSLSIDEADFAGSNRIGVHEVVGTTSLGYKNEYRVFNLTASASSLITPVISYALDPTYDVAAGSLSSDGLTVVLGHRLRSADASAPLRHSSVRLYSVGDVSGKPQSEWDDQLLPDFANGAGTFTFSPDSHSVLWTSAYGIVAASTGNKLGLTLSPTSVKSGGAATGTVSLSDPATANTTVLLTSSSAAVTVPASVTILSGQTSVDFSIATSGDAAVNATIKATAGTQNASATLAVTVPSLDTFTLSPTEVAAGDSSTGTITLTDVAPTSGATILLSASDPTAVTMDGSVSVTVGNQAQFVVKANSVTSKKTVTITARRGSVARSVTLTIDPPTVSTFALSANSVVGGSDLTGTITISAAAPSGGTAIKLTSSTSSISFSPTVSVPAGQYSVTFPISTKAVTTTANATLTATLNGTSTTASLQLLAVAVQSLTLNPTSVVGGTGLVTATVGLASPLPNDVTVALSSSNAAVASVPTTLTIPAGMTSGQVAVTTSSVTASTTATLTARLGGTSKTAALTVTPIDLSAVTISPTAVLGGSSTAATGTVSLSGPAPKGGAKVSLKSSSTDAATVASSVTIPAGATSATFAISHKAVASTKTVTITATLGKTSKAGTLTVQAPTLLSLSVSPTSVVGSGSTKVTGTVTISGPAPSSGMKVTLKSSNSSLSVPSSVTIGKGSKSATFTLSHKKVTVSTSVTVTATLNGVVCTATATVTP